MYPLLSDRNLRPSSTALVSPSGPAAVVDVAFQIVHGQFAGGGDGAAPVVNDHV
jgi:hypothetical protein